MASKRQLRWKSCGRKTRHATVRVAKRVARIMRDRHGDMNPYRCNFCGGWHIGHHG